MLSDDGWGDSATPEHLLEKYVEISRDMESNIVEKRLEGRKKKPVHVEEKKPEDHVEIYHMPDEDDDHDLHAYIVSKPRFFTPPLQQQRNTFVMNTLAEFRSDEHPLRKIAVLGCGALSLERTIIHEPTFFGYDRFVSVDIDEESLCKGLRSIEFALKHVDNVARANMDDPVLFEQYHGSILTYDDRLKDVDCVCSTEVIEHIPLPDAEKFMRLVLGKVQPRLFILSTPNHEYNAAFGMEPGQFRHDDHKYEFTRDEFNSWLQRIVPDYPEYAFRVVYVGNVNGFTHLSGATQFAVIYKESPAKTTINDRILYEKVGHSVSYGGLFFLRRHIILSAFRQWLTDHELDSTNIVKESYASFWRVYISELMVLINIPVVLMEELNGDTVMEVLKVACHSKIFPEPGVGGMAPHLVIPQCISKTMLLSYLK